VTTSTTPSAPGTPVAPDAPVLDSSVRTPAVTPPAVPGSPGTTTTGLARTGFGGASLLLLALGLVVTGGFLRGVARRRPAA
jgi:hypothetical protein